MLLPVTLLCGGKKGKEKDKMIGIYKKNKYIIKQSSDIKLKDMKSILFFVLIN